MAFAGWDVYDTGHMHAGWDLYVLCAALPKHLITQKKRICASQIILLAICPMCDTFCVTTFNTQNHPQFPRSPMVRKYDSHS